ncbi:MAG: SRPBCC family protein [Nocardioides sp.]
MMEQSTELGTLEREIYVDAPPETVFDVVSRPEHVKEWWPDDAAYDVTPGSNGQIRFGDPEAGGGVVGLTVMEVDPPRSFTFRWAQAPGETGVEGSSLLVTFALTPQGDGTLLRMTETGFREMGWETAVLEQQYREHGQGWDHFLPRIAPYIVRISAGEPA